MRKIVMAGLVALAAIAGLSVPAAAGSASAVVLPTVVRSGPAEVSFGLGPTANRISCGTAKTCFVAGTRTGSTATVSPLALAWNGTAWRSVVVHSPKGTTLQGMSGVSCKTATYCLVIGEDMGNGASAVIRPFAVTWNGKAISGVPVPPVPAGAVQTVLGGVSCVAVKSCVAGGVATTNSRAAKWVIDIWNGSKWTLHTAAAPSGALSAAVADSSCVSLSYCTVAANFLFNSSTIRPMLATWNGKTVSSPKVPLPYSSGSSLMVSVSCLSTSSCVATGANLSAATGSQKITAFTESWNGKVWTASKLTWPAGTTISLLEDVSCTYSKTAGRHCVAVGAAGTANTANPVAFAGNGSKWSALKVPAAAKGQATVLEGVSCLSAVNCVATGETGASNGTITSPVAGFWNGTVWKVTAA